MGFWGDELYENDVALDIRNRIDPDEYTVVLREIIRGIVEEIPEEYDEDEAPVAWLALADTLFDIGLMTATVKRKALQAADSFSHDMFPGREVVDQVVAKISGEQPKRKRVRKSRVKLPQWKNGDIFLYDISKENAEDPYFAGWNIGFWKTNDVNITAKERGANVYFFRTKYGFEELKENPELVAQAQFLPIAAYGREKHSYLMRPALTVWRDYYPEERIHYCGNYAVFPRLPYEYCIPGYKIEECASTIAIYYFETIEERLLHVRGLMDEIARYN